MITERFRFDIDPRFAPMLALLGVRSSTSHVVLTEDRLEVWFGRLKLSTSVANLRDVRITRDYRWFKAIGARGSMVDRGLTLGTNARAGVCVCFHEPVPLLLGDRLPHPAVTLTVQDPERFAHVVRDRIQAGDASEN